MGLTLTRHEGERIIITTDVGERIVIELRELRTTQARITIDAPRKFRIDREEIADETT